MNSRLDFDLVNLTGLRTGLCSVDLTGMCTGLVVDWHGLWKGLGSVDLTGFWMGLLCGLACILDWTLFCRLDWILDGTSLWTGIDSGLDLILLM